MPEDPAAPPKAELTLVEATSRSIKDNALTEAANAIKSILANIPDRPNDALVCGAKSTLHYLIARIEREKAV
jgi:hypothetical protein